MLSSVEERQDDDDNAEDGATTVDDLEIHQLKDPLQDYDVQKLQRECPDYKPVFEYFEYGVLPTDEQQARRLVMESERFIIDDGVLYHLFHPRSKRMCEMRPVIKQLCIPKILREDIMKAYHDYNCHIGQDRLYNTLKVKYWFPFLYSVLQYVASCDLCQKSKTSQHRKKAPLKPLEVVEPFGRVHGLCRSASNYV